MEENLSTYELLRFYVDIGVDDICLDEAQDSFKISENVLSAPVLTAQSDKKPFSMALPDSAPSKPEAQPVGQIEALQNAQELSKKAKSLDALKEAINEFKGIASKRTAKQMVFSDGNENAKIMFIGEAPGADEDRLGKPFVGNTGLLLDKMIGAIGLNRTDNAYITNVMNWRPPGNRNPTPSEIALSMPFIERHIELFNPDIIVTVGGIATKALLETKSSITRMRGKWIDYKTPNGDKTIPLMPIFHPSYLLRSPQQKAFAWADLLQIKAKIEALGILSSEKSA